MLSDISGAYRALAAHEIEITWKYLERAWCDPRLPIRQFQLAAHRELEEFRAGKSNNAYDALLEGLHSIECMHDPQARLLDVGAASGYYSEVLHLAGFPVQYTGIDYSESFKQMALRHYPRIDFRTGDARHLPLSDGSFDIVLSGGCISHIREYEQAISELVRVSRRYVILHRVPVSTKRPTTFFMKEAYGVPCIEIHFNKFELFKLLDRYSLQLKYASQCFFDDEEGYGHLTYFLEKAELFHHPV